MRFLLKASVYGIVGLFALGATPYVAYAALPVDKEEPITTADEEPVTMDDLISYRPPSDYEVNEKLPLDIRREAIIEASISFGARGGLAKRTYEIRQELDIRSRYLDKIFDFRHLLVSAPSGLLIEPPVVSESMNAMLIDIDGQTAAVSDKIYNIIRNAHIVSAPRTWRTYLEREWGEVMPPPDILTPQDEEEEAIWDENIQKGWKYGIEQADEIFAKDLAQLESDFHGMIRYRMLLAQGMISPPYALQVDRGITGGGDQMRVGDRAVQITGVPELITGADDKAKEWKPASR